MMTNKLTKQKLQFRDAPGTDHLWIMTLRAGWSFVYRGQDKVFEVSDLEQIASETRRALYAFQNYALDLGSPYRFPLLKEHERKGERFGYYDDLKVSDNALWVRAVPHPETLEKIRDGKIEYVSAGLDSVWKDEKGVEYGPILTELSFVSGPFFKSIGKIQDHLNITFSEDFFMDPEQVQALMDALADLISRVEALEAAQAAAPEEEAAQDEAMSKDQEQEMSGDQEEGMSMSDRLDQLTAQITQLNDRLTQAPPAAQGRKVNPGKAPVSAPRELGAWIAHTAKTRGITVNEAVKLSFTEFGQ